MSEQPLFRIQIDLVDGPIATFDNLPGKDVGNCVQRFIERRESGLSFMTVNGFVSWTWDEIRGVGGILMDQLTETERQPTTWWTASTTPPQDAEAGRG